MAVSAPVKSVYLIGSLRNPQVPVVANLIREAGYDCFDDWYAAGPEADDKWRDYERGRGRSYQEALSGFAAAHVFEFDKRHLDRCESGVLLLPAGKSGHLELGYMAGQGKPSHIVHGGPAPERWDVMVQFARYHDSLDAFLTTLKTGGLGYKPA